MTGKINLDEKSIIAANGEVYDIAGVIVRADKATNADAKDRIYEIESSFARACIWRDRKVDFLVTQGRAYIV